MTLEELGRTIKEKREAAGMSIDDVAARIKISARILRTIEGGSLVGLPHAVYTKSFIRSFGLLVGYDAQELNAALEGIFPPDIFDESKANSILLRASPAMAYPNAGKRFALMLFFLVLIAGLISGGWYVAVNYGDRVIETIKAPFSAITAPFGETQERQPPAVPAETSGAASGLSDSLSALMAQSSSVGGGAAQPQVAPPPDNVNESSIPQATHTSPASAGVDASGSENTVEQSLQRNEDPASAAGTALMEASAPGGKNSLLVRARAECWVSVRADGGRPREYMVHAGTNVAVTYDERLEITFGNAGGVSLSHNGKELGTPGLDRQVAVLRFPSQE